MSSEIYKPSTMKEASSGGENEVAANKKKVTRKEFVDVFKGSMAALTLYGFFRMTLGEKPQSPVSPLHYQPKLQW